MKIALIVLIVGVLGGCAYLQGIQDSPQFKQFCSWSPVAISGIEQAVVESAKDPAKVKVTTAMTQALMYLKLAASQCPPAAVEP